MSQKKHRDGCETAITCDCPTLEELRAEYVAEIAQLESGGEHAPWLTREAAIADARERLSKLDLAPECAESPRTAGDGSPEPFCACGRRISECDRSRNACTRRSYNK